MGSSGSRIVVPLDAQATFDADLAADLAEVQAAIDLVDGVRATRVRLVGLRVPESIIGLAVARAQARGIAVRVDRAGTVPALIVGPRI